MRLFRDIVSSIFKPRKKKAVSPVKKVTRVIETSNITHKVRSGIRWGNGTMSGGTHRKIARKKKVRRKMAKSSCRINRLARQAA